MFVGGWAEAHGYDAQLGAQNVTMSPFATAAYLELKRRQTTKSLDEVVQRAHAMDLADIIAFAAQRLGNGLPAESRRAQL